MSKASEVLGKIILWLLVIVLIVGVAFVALFFAMRNQGVTYYVEYGGERFFGGSSDGLALLNGGTYNFSVKSLTGGEVNYGVTVQSNSANNFTFVCDGKPQAFYGTDEESNDYSEIFDLKKGTGGFSLTIPEDFTVEKAIEAKYGADIVFQDEIKNGLCYFIISVWVEKTSISLWFAFGGRVENITLDPPQIIF